MAIRIGFLGVMFTALLTVAASAQSESQPAAADVSLPIKKTLVYKVVDGVEIKADIYLPEGNAEPRPVVVWFHGGALMMGRRGDIPKQYINMAASDGIVAASFDYRLIPETKLPEVIEDVKDAIAWLRASGPELFNVDPDRMVVAGASAGGYLALMSGYIVRPAPTAIVSYWGYGDIDGEPSEYFLKSPLISDEEAWALIGNNVPTNSDETNGKARWRFFTYLKQTGGWAKAAAGIDPATEPEKLTPFCPIKNITADYPPTLLIHGTKDVDVPYEKSVEMSKALEEHGIPQRLITIKDGGHGGFGGDPELAMQAFEDSFEFVREQLNAK